jgi:hypothetical protein
MVSAVSGSAAALQGQIKRDQLDLDDWVTCVSAKTPKGKAEIQKISGEINAAKEKIARIEANAPSSPTLAPSSSATAAAATPAKSASGASGTTPSDSGAQGVRDHGGLIDVWA